MRQTLSKGMVVAAAATSILSLYGTPAFADSNANGSAQDSPGVGSGNNLQLPVNVPVNACGNTVDVIGALNPVFGNSCANGRDSGSHGAHGAPHSSSGSDGSSGYGSGSGHSGGGHPGGHGSGHGGHSGDSGGDSGGGSGSSAYGETHGSPGILSGNNAQVPVDVPVNACGNTADVVGVGNPTFGNDCGNGPAGYGDTPPTTPPPTTPPPTTPPKTPPTKPPTTPPTTPPPTPPTSTTPPSTPPPTVPGAPRNTPPGTPPALPHTGSEGLLATSAASAALLAGGTVLYRRGRAASRR
ncbi:chaplin [Streptomyces sp. NPDC005808]|uniref:chaplin n=1 Tax=Streptomyces sp. NPDC005808 TaxID=3364734 RepID=UPI00367DB5E4